MCIFCGSKFIFGAAKKKEKKDKLFCWGKVSFAARKLPPVSAARKIAKEIWGFDAMSRFCSCKICFAASKNERRLSRCKSATSFVASKTRGANLAANFILSWKTPSSFFQPQMSSYPCEVQVYSSKSVFEVANVQLSSVQSLYRLGRRGAGRGEDDSAEIFFLREAIVSSLVGTGTSTLWSCPSSTSLPVSSFASVQND